MVQSDEVGVHLATSADGLRTVFSQGHPEYDTISLLKEYKREVLRYADKKNIDAPPFPAHYFGAREQAVLKEFLKDLKTKNFPEAIISPQIDNTWHDTAEAVVGNWMGLVYQVTHSDRGLPFMDGVNPDDPLGLKN